MNLNNITTALKTGITIYQYEQWQNTGSVNLMQKESHHKETEILHQLEISNLLEQLKNN